MEQIGESLEVLSCEHVRGTTLGPSANPVLGEGGARVRSLWFRYGDWRLRRNGSIPYLRITYSRKVKGMCEAWPRQTGRERRWTERERSRVKKAGKLRNAQPYPTLGHSVFYSTVRKYGCTDMAQYSTSTIIMIVEDSLRTLHVGKSHDCVGVPPLSPLIPVFDLSIRLLARDEPVISESTWRWLIRATAASTRSHPPTLPEGFSITRMRLQAHLW